MLLKDMSVRPPQAIDLEKAKSDLADVFQSRSVVNIICENSETTVAVRPNVLTVLFLSLLYYFTSHTDICGKSVGRQLQTNRKV